MKVCFEICIGNTDGRCDRTFVADRGVVSDSATKVVDLAAPFAAIGKERFYADAFPNDDCAIDS